MSLNENTPHEGINLSEMTPEEILSAAQAQGVELSEEQLEDIAGGDMWDAPGSDGCPDCGSTNYTTYNIGHTMHFKCKDCGRDWC